MTVTSIRPSLTRRRLLLGTAAIAANALVAACGGGSSATDTPKAAPATTAPTAAPVTATPVAVATATFVPPTVAPTLAPTVAPTLPPTAPPTVAATPAATASLSVPAVSSRLAATTAAPTLPLILFAGAGATNGAGLPPTATYPSQTIALLAPAKYDAVNLGGTGDDWTIARMNDQAPTDIDPLYAAGRSKNIVVLFDFHNDLYTGVTAEETYARVVTFCQARRKVGFKVVIGTLTPGDVAIQPAQGRPSQDYEPVRQAVNTLIRANRASFADALADVGADSAIGAPEAGASREYFQRGGFRLTANGAGIVAGIVKMAILTL